MTQDTALQLTLFGSPVAILDNQPIHIGRRKAVALLAYLAMTQRRHSRAHLSALLWPEYDEAGARGELRRSLSTLNQTLGADWISADRNQVALNDASDLHVDVLAFRRHLAVARHSGADQQSALLAAVELAQAEFMAGFIVDNTPDFEEWQRFEAGALRRDLAWALAQLSQPAADHDPAHALTYATRWLALDPLDEAAHRRLMELHAAAGDLSAAYRQYQACKQLLAQELDAPPAPETTALYDQIRAGEYPIITTANVSSAVASTPRHHNLPAQLTPFIGRAYELHELMQRLADPAQRLVTIMGPGGIGKTRVALQLARAVIAQPDAPWRDGVYLVNLAAVETLPQLVAAIVEALPLVPQGSTPLDAQLLTYLQQRQLLLVLDNVEHLLPAIQQAIRAGQTDLLTAILQHAPDVKILSTSRERLNLVGESAFPLLGMPFPAQADDQTATYAAVQLFCESARRVDSTFRLTADVSQPVVQICQLVQGMPLAITLAAAWVGILGVADIAAEIAQSIDFLTATAHNVPTRHQSMRAVFEHSWRLLNPAEQHALAQLALFRNGFTRADAATVANAALPVLRSLLNKSLIWRDQAGRYYQHELLRQYGTEKLSDDPEEARRARRRFGQWYVAFLQQQAVQLQGTEQTAAIRAIAAEMENIRYSWQWMIAEGALAQIAQAMEGFYLYCFMQQTLREGYELFAAALHHFSALPAGEVAPDNPVALRFRLQLYRAAMVQGIGLTDNVAADLQQCLAYFEEHNMAAESALTMSELGRLASMSGTQQETTHYLQESLTRWRARQASWYLTQTLLVIAYESFMRGDFGESRRLAEEMLEIARQTQNHWGMESAMRLLGLNARELGDYTTGLSYLQQCLQMVRARANRGLEGYVLENLASLHFSLGEVDKAEPLIHASLALANETGQMRLLGYAIHALGEIQMYRDNPAQAEQSFRRALDIFRPQGYRWAEASVLHTLGQALCRLERFAEARAAQRESMAIANEAGALAILLTALTAYAETLAFQREYDRATEIVLATMAHPARESATLKTGNRVLALLADRLGPATAQAIQEQVALPLSASEGALPIDQLVAQLCTEILAEL